MKSEWTIRKNFLLIVLGSFLLMCILVFYPLFIDIWIENDSGNLYTFAQKIYNQKISSIFIILVLSFALAFIYWVYIKYKQSVRHFEQETRETSRTLLRKYRELKEFDEKKTLSIVMKKFSLKHDLIYAIQIYKYNNVPEKNILRCKIKYVDGYVKERIDINGMIEQNYYLNKKIYKEYTDSVNKFFYDTNIVGPLLQFISKYVKIIQNKPIESIRDQDALTFALLKDGLNALSTYYPGISNIVIDTDKVNKLEELLKKQRNGIYRGILLGGFYTFFYDGKGTKEGRQYITNPITLSNVQYITLITLDPDLLEENQEEKNSQLSGYLEEFEEMLHEAFEREYNNIEGDEYNAI